MNENICQISTSLGVGAISIIRCSGPDVINIVNKIFNGKDLTKVNSHTINYGHIVYKDEIIDEVLVSVMKAPKTYTMEDIVEINSHGGISTTNKILEILLTIGCRIAENGEFTKKAFLNGRIDLTQAESVNDLIDSITDEQRNYALNLLEGNLSKLIKENRSILLNLEATLEVNYDYPEEVDNPKITYESLKKDLLKIKDNLEKLLATANEGKLLKTGIDVAIVGKPNVGKSSILNHLLDENKAIVTDIAGTTRDIVEGSISINGLKLNLIDTAGIRKTNDLVESIGVDKSLDIIKKVDLVIYVLNNNEDITKEDLETINSIEDSNLIILINKNDLDKKIDESLLKDKILVYSNTLNPNGLDELKNKIKELFATDNINNKNYNLLSNARQISLVRKALNSIQNALISVNNEVPFEMISVDIKESFDYLGEILGVNYKEELLDELFKNFCLGK